MPEWLEYRVRDPLDGTILADLFPDRMYPQYPVDAYMVREKLDYWTANLKRQTESGQPYVERRRVVSGAWERIPPPAEDDWT
jgi:hypothetical protein